MEVPQNKMAKKQFKAESKRLLDLMINSIYTNKEIFLREIISNASDAIDKLCYLSLTDDKVGLNRDDFRIDIILDEEKRTITVRDNGIGMNQEDAENNLGIIAKSGSFKFKNEMDAEKAEADDVSIIGQFGVGFYSAFMVADEVTVVSRKYGEEQGIQWQSKGADGYTVTECDKPTFGTEILLRIKADGEDEKYSEFLEEYRIRSLVKKYSDYIRYPIKMEVTKSRKKEGSENEYESYRETETLNSMVPLWKRTASEVTKEEYNAFYTEKFYDYEPPLCTVTQKSEGTVTYNALMFVPSHAPFNYYTKDYERGLELYSSGVLIMERCADLLPEYFGFVRGVVDSADLSLNISREMLQHDRQLGVMTKAIEKKIKQELSKLMNSEREKYERFFDAFGIQLKYGIYSDYGMHKDTLVDLILFRSSKENKYVSFKEYTDAMTETQKYIYYATGESAAKIEMLPQLEAMKARGYEVLYLTDDVDEFTLKVIGKYSDKEFKNITSEAEDLATEDAKESVKRENEGSKEMLELMKEAIGKVSEVRFTASLVKHPVCLSSKGELSVGMEKVLSKMPGADEGAPKAEVALEINSSHPISNTLKALYETDREKLKKYAKILYSVASMISGVSVDNPLELCELVSELMI